MGKAPSDKNKYFWKGISVNSIPSIIALLDAAKARMQASNLQMLDQTSLTKETFVSALCIWAYKTIEQHGIGHMEELLRQPFAEMSQMVAEEMKRREAMKLEEERRNAAPEGFSKPSTPRKAKGAGDNPPDRKRRRRSS